MSLPANESMEATGRMPMEQHLRTFSDPTRLRILVLICNQGELCVCELGHALNVAQPKISRHLALLRDLEIVRDRRDAQWVFYRVNPELPAWLQGVLTAVTGEAEFRSPYIEDLRRLEAMPGRPEDRCA